MARKDNPDPDIPAEEIGPVDGLDDLEGLPGGTARPPQFTPPPEDGSGIRIRGGGSDETPFVVDGSPVEPGGEPAALGEEQIEEVQPLSSEHGAASGVVRPPGIGRERLSSARRYLRGPGPLGIQRGWWWLGAGVVAAAAVVVGVVGFGGSDGLEGLVDPEAEVEWVWFEDPLEDTTLCVDPGALTPDPEADIVRVGVRPAATGVEVRVETAGSPGRAWRDDYSFAVTVEVASTVAQMMMAERHAGEETVGRYDLGSGTWEQAMIEVTDTAVLFTVTGLDEQEILDVRVTAAHTVEIGGNPVCDEISIQARREL